MKVLWTALALIFCTPAWAQQNVTVNFIGGLNGISPTQVSSTNPLPVTLNGATANQVRGSASTTNTGATTIIAAPSANKLYITGAQCFRTDAGTTAAYVTFNDGASTIMGLANLGGGGGNNMVFSTPLVVAAMTAFTFTASTNISTVYCNAQGYNAP